jgi:hypothetical protein
MNAVSNSIGSFVPSMNKAGKITATAEKRAVLLNGLDNRGILSVALNGKGAMARQAANAISADSLESLLSSEVALSGDQIASLRAFLVGQYGEGGFNRATMRGLGGMVTYLEGVTLLLNHRFMVSETAKGQENAIKAIDGVRVMLNQLSALIVLRDNAILASQASIVANVAPEVVAEVVVDVVVDVVAEVATKKRGKKVVA